MPKILREEEIAEMELAVAKWCGDAPSVGVVKLHFDGYDISMLIQTLREAQKGESLLKKMVVGLQRI